MPKTPRRIFPTVEQVRQLPLQHTMEIPSEWEDRNGHVNVQFYLTLYELGAWNIMEEWGFNEAWFEQQGFSVFDLEHHLNYLAEIRIGDTISAYHRIVGHSEKRFHGIYFVVNDTADRLASCLEYVATSMDMNIRQTAALPSALAKKLGESEREHDLLSWAAPTCGWMHP